eukprot:CAMPEP_0168773248 /NCGR_PEP_ID=MMETSP0725-20121227/4377_1 /TAXON_ID=265536 /ORGANISM="Amphiprora sp., Strain CCMP467" /LENGTH=117 /DNA_ID=CAMNT_0008822797 /DNA_START=659 /DNA_END=1010 /DNA_ORIENTATION=+
MGERLLLWQRMRGERRITNSEGKRFITAGVQNQQTKRVGISGFPNREPFIMSEEDIVVWTSRTNIEVRFTCSEILIESVMDNHGVVYASSGFRMVRFSRLQDGTLQQASGWYASAGF